MIPGKENLIAIEKMAEAQKRIYDDACDVGVLATQEVREAMQVNVRALREIYVMKRDYWKGGQSVEFFVLFEIDEGMYVGCTYKISYCKDDSRNIMFYSIEPRRDMRRQDQNPFVRQ